MLFLFGYIYVDRVAAVVIRLRHIYSAPDYSSILMKYAGMIDRIRFSSHKNVLR